MKTIWSQDYLETQKRLLGNRIATRELTADEKIVVKLLDNPEWKAFTRVVLDRATKAKSRLYREELSQKELEVGKLLGSLEALEWAVRLPDTLLHTLSSENTHEKSA